jgi:uncharacterized protein (TIGR02246 family)
MATPTRLDLRSGGLEVMRAILRLPLWPEWATPDLRQRLVQEELALRDDLVAYAYALDAGDLEALLDHFSDDVVITNPRGRYEGIETVRKNYVFLMQNWPRRRDVWGNVAIRFLGSADEAYRTSYIQEVLATPSKETSAVTSDIHRLRKMDGRWRIVERCIATDLIWPISPPLAGPHEVTDMSKVPVPR